MNKNDDYKEPLTANIGEGFGEVLKNYKAGNPDSNSVSGKDESPALKDAKDLGAAATKKKEGVPFFEFGRKYKDFFQKDVFSEFNENTKKPSGQWLHISSYDANKGTVEYYLGKAGGRNRYDEKKEANLNELDEILKGYSYSLKGEGIGIKKNPEKSSKKKGAATIKKIQEKPDKKKEENEITEKALTLAEFHQKYPRIIGKKLFNKEGEEVYIYEYKGGLVKCFFGKDAKPKKIKLSEFEAVLGEYGHKGESGKKTISTEKEKKEALHKKIEEQKKNEIEVKPAQESQELLDELDNFKTFAEDFLERFLGKLKEKDWDGFRQENKKTMQRIMTEAELVKMIRKHGEFVKKEDAEKVAKEIAEKII